MIKAGRLHGAMLQPAHDGLIKAPVCVEAREKSRAVARTHKSIQECLERYHVRHTAGTERRTATVQQGAGEIVHVYGDTMCKTQSAAIPALSVEAIGSNNKIQIDVFMLVQNLKFSQYLKISSCFVCRGKYQVKFNVSS